MIDICDFAAGLSRQLYGLTIASERGEHRMMETWHPLGVTGIISAFNFPVAVWAWNAALALVCGNPCVWKPSEKTPLTALATQALFDRALAQFKEAGNPASEGLSSVFLEGVRLARRSPITARAACFGDWFDRDGTRARPAACGALRTGDPRTRRQQRGYCCPSADLDLTLRAVAFAAMGTAGQRCTPFGGFLCMRASTTASCRA